MCDISHDALPQQEERSERLLVLDAYERAPKLDGLLQKIQTAGAELKQRTAVQAPLPVTRQDLRQHTHAVGPNDLLLRMIPEEQVTIICVEQVDVARAPRALARSTKRDLTQPPDLLQAPWCLSCRDGKDAELAAL